MNVEDRLAMPLPEVVVSGLIIRIGWLHGMADGLSDPCGGSNPGQQGIQGCSRPLLEFAWFTVCCQTLGMGIDCAIAPWLMEPLGACMFNPATHSFRW